MFCCHTSVGGQPIGRVRHPSPSRGHRISQARNKNLKFAMTCGPAFPVGFPFHASLGFLLDSSSTRAVIIGDRFGSSMVFAVEGSSLKVSDTD